MRGGHSLFSYLLLVCFAVLVRAGGHGHGHGHALHHLQHQLRRNSHDPVSSAVHVPSPSPHPGSGVSEATVMVSKALEALAVINKLRLETVKHNNYTLAEPDQITGERINAPPLDYSEDTVSHLMTANHLLSRDDSGPMDGESQKSFTYRIPDDLAEAARILAESSPPSPSTGEHAALAATVHAKHRSKTNDTNRPPQKLRQPNGLFEHVPDQTVIESPPAAISSHSSNLGKRAASGSDFWMANMEQLGESPFAPDGYKVWRNVKDYGAKGDGVTDDTAAINKAISDGNRCGADCGSSTVYPAVVFFPPGTYLVSSSIIQYYNTQFLGDPTDYPTILAAKSFVGLGVITADVYVGDKEQWYINTNNFLRHIRNFKMDITRTDPNAYVCAIHWQVAQGTALENIEFYMSMADGNTQQGIYMENGSGGFMSNLTFVGGNFGAYLGNQQFTTSQLIFVNCKTAVQIHWDWAWTMQDVVIESCGTGVVIVGGAGDKQGDNQGVGSYILVDTLIANTKTGIMTSIYGRNSTSVMLQNVGFFNVQNAILADTRQDPILAGGNEVMVDSWGFGLYADDSGIHFAQQTELPVMPRKESLSGSTSYVPGTYNYFTRRRPQYHDLGGAQVFDVKAYGAKGDGQTDDSLLLNAILAVAANMSAIVYFPYGVYTIKDTLHVPVGSRIIGQVWPQIMATGPRFEDMENPHVAVEVGKEGDVGIIEIQNMVFTVSGPTAGAVLMEWNVHESSKGSAGLWDSHFRVGGATGSKLQAKDCPKQISPLKDSCIAASTLLHITKSASAYMENVWAWTADHDLDIKSQDQLDVFVARGILIESQGPTWLYGTSSEHNVLYQYQLSGAKDIVMGMIQTESPYFQPSPPAPRPFSLGQFADDPDFLNCKSSEKRCATSWGVRIVDSESIYMLGAGLYSWFNSYSQECVETNNCQQRGFHVEQSNDIWIVNLVTKAIIESISPLGEIAIYAQDSRNGYTSSLLGWFREGKLIGERNFTGFHMYEESTDSHFLSEFTSVCRTSMTQRIDCHDETYLLQGRSWKGGLGNDTLSDLVCSPGCEASIASWFNGVAGNCATEKERALIPTRLGGQLWAGWNETCLKDPDTDRYCGDVIADFTQVSMIEELPTSELCSFCNVRRYQMMQSTSYSVYDKYYQSDLEYINEACGLSLPTEMPDPLMALDDPYENDIGFCASDITYTAKFGDTCDTIAKLFKVSSAALFMGNLNLLECSSIPEGTKLCIPFSCEVIHVLENGDTCKSIEEGLGIEDANGATIRKYNPWLTYDCANLHESSDVAYGHVLCAFPQAGNSTTSPPGQDTTTPGYADGYAIPEIPPPDGATLAEGTTYRCGRWHTVTNEEIEETCCTLVEGLTYCVGPTYEWDLVFDPEDEKDWL
ncbi:pectate lyase superfamily protein-domain-containing protein [Aspergillus granulosus]|uniref:Pectate lyase superfamily protein-domain-containing protein n=1 Tax=Aspergillus granulosus TaxID=176169 RepID=A0ABR4H6D6_9EURO